MKAKKSAAAKTVRKPKEDVATVSKPEGSDELREELRESYTKMSPLRNAVRTQFGIAAGENRKAAVPEWPEKFIKVKDLVEHLKIKAADNIHEEKSSGWWTKLLTEVAQQYIKAGVKKEDVAAKIVAEFPIGKRRIWRYLPDEYKRTTKVRAGREGGKRKAATKEVARPEQVVPRAEPVGPERNGPRDAGHGPAGPERSESEEEGEIVVSIPPTEGRLEPPKYGSFTLSYSAKEEEILLTGKDIDVGGFSLKNPKDLEKMRAAIPILEFILARVAAASRLADQD